MSNLIRYSAEEILETQEACPKFAKIKNRNKQQFILAWIDHSQLGNVGLAKALNKTPRTIYNYLRDDEVLETIRAVSLTRCSMANAKAGAIKDLLVDRIAEKLITHNKDVADLCDFEQTILKESWNKIDPADGIKIQRTETIKGGAGTSLQDLLKISEENDDSIDV